MEDDGTLPPAVLASMLMRMFEFAPIAMAITTHDALESRYIKVNDAYLRLTGLNWENIRGRKLTSAGAAIDSPARNRRHRMLAEEGSYVLEEVDIAHTDGTIVPTLISAQRTVVDGVAFDVEVIVDISARVRQQREIENALKAAARTDALSGLPNRASFDETIDGHIASQEPGGRTIALAFIDLNGFKAVNDTLGHTAGDEVLRVIARRLHESFRTGDFIARIGGDEFAILIETTSVQTSELQDNLQDIMERVFKPIAIDGNVTYTGAAVGVTFLQADDTATSFIKRADTCMYAAKTTGERVAVVCFDQQFEKHPLKAAKAGCGF